MKKYWMIFFLILMVGCQSVEKNLVKLKSDYAADRIEAIYWIFENAPEQDRQKLLIDASKDKSEVVRSLALRLMALEENPKYGDYLLAGLKDKKSPLVRMEAVQSLGYLKNKDTILDISKLAMAAKEKNLWVRLKALKSLEYMKALEALEDLSDLLEDDEPAIAFQAKLILEKFTDQNLGTDKENWQEFLKKISENKIKNLEMSEEKKAENLE
jgi:HEAT repeat protein